MKTLKIGYEKVKWFWTHLDIFKASGSQQRLVQLFRFTSLQLRRPSPRTLNPKPKIACPLQRTLKEFGGHQFSWSIPVPKQHQQTNERRMKIIHQRLHPFFKNYRRQKCDFVRIIFPSQKKKWKVKIYWFQKKNVQEITYHLPLLIWIGMIKMSLWLKKSCLKQPEFYKTPWPIGMIKAQMKNWCF